VTQGRKNFRIQQALESDLMFQVIRRNFFLLQDYTWFKSYLSRCLADAGAVLSTAFLLDSGKLDVTVA
jgi:hypothetical protein